MKNQIDELRETYPHIVYLDNAVYRDKKNILFTYEPQNIHPYGWDYDNLKEYKAVVTWNKAFYDMYKDKLNIYYYKGYPILNRRNYEKKVKYSSKVKGVVLICKYRNSPIEYDISYKRFNILADLNDCSDYICHHYGAINYFDPLAKGIIGEHNTEETFPSSINKLSVLSNYRYNLCFENCYHELWSHDYITEKIYDCFRAGTVPIYWGCYNIEQHIPRKLYIDYREFDNAKDLLKKLDSITERKYNTMINEAYEFDKKSKWGCVDRFIKFMVGIK